MMQPSTARGLVTERTLWIGGAQWAGKTTVAQILAMRHGLVHYSYDYHDARAHMTKAMSQPDRYPHRSTIRSADDEWVETSPRAMAQRAMQSFRERFVMVLEELAALPGSTPILADGWGLRPDLVLPHLHSPRQAVFLVPSESPRYPSMQEPMPIDRSILFFVATAIAELLCSALPGRMVNAGNSVTPP